MEPKNNEIEKLKRFYDDVYYQKIENTFKLSKHYEALADKLGITPGDQVLDIACGKGDWLNVCKQKGAHIAGIDLSSKAIDHCKKHLPDGEFYAQPAEQLPFRKEAYDVITCLGSLEHFVEPVIALKEMVRVAKPDARFILLVPNADFLTRKLGLYRGTNQKDAKEVVRTLEEWESLFNESGLKVQERWKDLHVLTWNWVKSNGYLSVPLRGAQAMALALWPLRWQYQVYHQCVRFAQ